MNSSDVIIIGAGISGLVCATELKRAGFSVLLIDKGRGFGGRMATRRIEGGRFDHGAQYFTVRGERFQAYVDEWLEKGIVREWFRHAPVDTNPEGYPRYCGVEGMTAPAKFLAESLDVIRGERVSELSRQLNSWVLKTDSDMVLSAEQLIITAPLPQALGLLDTTGLNYAGDQIDALRRVHYEKGLATLAVVEGQSGLPKEGFVFCSGQPLSWIADNLEKGISEVTRTITIHADARFADEHWESPNEVRGPLMLEAARKWMSGQVVDYQCHRWGFTTPINPWYETFFSNAALRLTLAGDAFGGPRIEGAVVSGLDAADSVIQRCGMSVRGS